MRRCLPSYSCRNGCTLVSQAREAFEITATLGDTDAESDPQTEAGASALSGRGAKTALVREMGALVRELKQWSAAEAGGGGGEALADGWETATDPASGRAYFYHVDTRAVQWDRPRPEPLPPPPPPPLQLQLQQGQDQQAAPPAPARVGAPDHKVLNLDRV